MEPEKSLGEIVDSLVYKVDEGTFAPVGPLSEENQRKAAWELLKRNPKLVEVLRTPLQIVAVRHSPGCLMEMPLSQEQPLNARLGHERVGVRAARTAALIKEFPRSAVLSVYNERLKKNEICIERSIFRVVCKLMWFRIRGWWDSIFSKQ